MKLNNGESLVPTCEKHVEYLFARFHHLLGFEKVLEFRTQFPDVIALRNGVIIRIELESKVTQIASHYKVAEAFINREQKFEQEKNCWYLVDASWKTRTLFDDEGGNLFVKKYALQHILRRKSLKPVLDVIVCWEINYVEPRRKEILAKEKYRGVEVIELKSKLEELGATW